MSRLLLIISLFLFVHNALADSISSLEQSSDHDGSHASKVISQPMKFYGYLPKYVKILGGNAWTIYANGVIDDDTPNRLKTFIDKNNIPEHSDIFFNSPGGSLMAGMELGKIVRNAGLFAYIGKGEGGKNKNVAGECFSACALAFLGGQYRWVDSSSSYGVHRFSFTKKISHGVDVSQVLSALVAQYIRDMGANPELFSVMTLAGSDSITVLSQEQLKEYKVANDGYDTTHWSIENYQTLFYLKGERKTWRGVNKFLLMCSPSKDSMFLQAIFDPEGRGDEVVQMKSYLLNLDDESTPITQYLYEGPKLINGWVNISFLIDKNLISSIQNAKEVGVQFQFEDSSPFFFGFRGMEFADGAKKLPALEANCFNQ